MSLPYARRIRPWAAPLVAAALITAASPLMYDSPSAGAVVARPESKAATLRALPRNEESGPLTPAEETRFEDVVEEITPLGDIAQHEDELADLGLVIVSDTGGGGGRTAARTSTGDDLTVPRPQVLWDTSNQRYYAYASYNWKAGSTEDHYYDIGNFSGSCVDSPCDIGGYDGFGMRFSRNLQNVSVSSIFCGRGDLDRDWAQFSCTTPTNPDENSSQGVTWRKQDKIYKTVVKPDNNMYIGSTSMVVKKPSCGAAVQLYSRYTHTWQSTSLTSFTIGSGGWSVTFSGGDNKWNAASQSGTWDSWDPC
jgi:hypothetical protein